MKGSGATSSYKIPGVVSHTGKSVHTDYTENFQKPLALLSYCFHGPPLVTRMNNKVMQNTMTMNCKLIVKYARTLMVTTYLFSFCLFMKLI
jgi:hypothetical protein